MRTRSRVSIALTLCAALSRLAACGDDPVRPPDPALRGTVVDSTGAPVAGARIGILYHFPVSSWPEPRSAAGDTAFPPDSTILRQNSPNPFEHSTSLRFTNAAPTITRLSIHDRSGKLVRSLLDRESPAGHHLVIWDGRDDGGAPVPAGAYAAQLRNPSGDSTRLQEIRMFQWVFDANFHFDAPLAVTDASGRFALRLADLPIGERVAFVTAEGAALGGHPVLSTLQVCASLGRAGPGARSDPTDVGDRSRDVSVTIRFLP